MVDFGDLGFIICIAVLLLAVPAAFVVSLILLIIGNVKKKSNPEHPLANKTKYYGTAALVSGIVLAIYAAIFIVIAVTISSGISYM